jgi:hypothetical protein
VRLRYARSPRPVIRLVGAGRPNAFARSGRHPWGAGYRDPIRTPSGVSNPSRRPALASGHRHTFPVPADYPAGLWFAVPIPPLGGTRLARLFTLPASVPLSSGGRVRPLAGRSRVTLDIVPPAFGEW